MEIRSITDTGHLQVIHLHSNYPLLKYKLENDMNNNRVGIEG